MTEAQMSSSRKMQWAIGLAAGFCLIMLTMLIVSVISGFRATPEAVKSADAEVIHLSVSQIEVARPSDMQTALESASPGGIQTGEPDLTDIEIIRHKEENAAALYQHLRDYAKENPDADDALSEERIRSLEKAGAIAM